MQPSAKSVLERHGAKAAAQPSSAPPTQKPVWKVTPSGGGDDVGRRRRIKYAILIAFVLCLFIPYPFHVGGTAEVLPAQRVILNAQMEGMVEDIFFDSGDFVSAGTRIAQIADHRQVRDLESAVADREAITYEIEKLRTTPTPEEVASASSKVDSARITSKYADDDLKRAQLLFSKGSSSTQELEDFKQKADQAKEALAETEANLAAVKAQVNPNQISTLEAQKAKMDSEIKLNKELLRRTAIVTPISGQIVTKDLKYKLKSFMKEGNEFAVVEDLQTVLIQVSVPEPEIGEVKVGARLRLRLWSYPEKEFEGTVEQILPAAEELSTDAGRTVPVLGRMDNASGELRSGLTGQAKIKGEPTFVIVAFTRALVRFVFIELWSWIP
ncbi:MAG: HlyD family secretion protein [Chthoniobacterales bacterium]